MNQATAQDKQALLDFLGADLVNCLYLYLDVYHYGLGPDGVQVWYEPAAASGTDAQDSDALVTLSPDATLSATDTVAIDTDVASPDAAPVYNLVVMKFGDSFQVYSPNNEFSAEEVFELAKEHEVVRVHAPATTIRKLQPVFGNGYDAAFGQIFEKTKTRNLSTQHHLVERVGLDDVEEAAAVILSAEEFAHSYTLDDMKRTLTSLIESGIGACFCIREGGVMAATEAITASSDVFMITS